MDNVFTLSSHLLFSRDHASPISKPLSASGLRTLQICLRTTAALSLLGALSIIVAYVTRSNNKIHHNKKRYSGLPTRFVLWMSVADVVASIAMLVGDSAFGNTEQAACRAQGFAIQFSLMASMFWTLSMSTSIVFAVFRSRLLIHFTQYEKYHHLVAWGVPLVLALILLVFDNGNGPVYRPAVLWCWIGDPHSIYRMLFFYGPLWVIFLINALAYIAVGWRTWRSKRAIFNAVKASRRSVNLNLEQTDNSLATMHTYILKTLFYMLAFFFGWFFPTINRVQSMIDPGHPVLGLYILHAIFAPLAGFLNSIVYFWIAPSLLNRQRSPAFLACFFPHSTARRHQAGHTTMSTVSTTATTATSAVRSSGTGLVANANHNPCSNIPAVPALPVQHHHPYLSASQRVDEVFHPVVIPPSVNSSATTGASYYDAKPGEDDRIASPSAKTLSVGTWATMYDDVALSIRNSSNLSEDDNNSAVTYDGAGPLTGDSAVVHQNLPV
ncbi:slime mold cyclic AMP receptor-domain-containing protein [Powellomyces hirtus]|nr:slime mold cyclic AMP receptor-domain-containing protein [Powellomyces hirtus]